MEACSMADNPQSGGNRCGARISGSLCSRLAGKWPDSAS